MCLELGIMCPMSILNRIVLGDEERKPVLRLMSLGIMGQKLRAHLNFFNTILF